MEDFLKKVKDYLYYVSVGVSLIGILGTLIIMVLAYNVMDVIEKQAITQIEQTGQIVSEVESGIWTVIDEVSSLNKTVDEIDKSLDGLGDAIITTGSEIKTFGSLLETISFGANGESLVNAGESLRDTGASINNLDFDEHKDGILKIKNDLKEVQNQITQQKEVIVGAKKTSQDVFSTLKLIVIIFGILEILLFGVILLNSVAGLGN